MLISGGCLGDFAVESSSRHCLGRQADGIPNLQHGGHRTRPALVPPGWAGLAVVEELANLLAAPLLGQLLRTAAVTEPLPRTFLLFHDLYHMQDDVAVPRASPNSLNGECSYREGEGDDNVVEKIFYVLKFRKIFLPLNFFNKIIIIVCIITKLLLLYIISPAPLFRFHRHSRLKG